MSNSKVVAGGFGALAAVALTGAVAGAVAGAGDLVARFYAGQRRADALWATTHYARLQDIGTVERLAILPLIDWYPAREGLAREAGVSYLVQADDRTLLFDLGLNRQGDEPSPLLRNMRALGIDPGRLDALVISHVHIDHVGGDVHELRLSPEHSDFHGIPAYVPSPVACPTARTILVDRPMRIMPGVATMGPIGRQDFVMGPMVEQSLAVNVRGKGLVLIVGCGHPTIQRIIARAESLFEEPIYGFAGGLHYPVTGSRLMAGKVPLQRVLGTGKWPWDGISRADVEAGIACVQARRPALVALSPHDSCDWSVEAFRAAFGEAYRDLRVGDEIVVA